MAYFCQTRDLTFHRHNALIILIEAESHIAEDILNKYMNQIDFSPMKDDLRNEILRVVDKSQDDGAIGEILSLIVPNFCIKRHFDERIERVLKWIDLKAADNEWDGIELLKAIDVACLSKSRFLHLFSSELGIPWRPYLLWRRLLTTIDHVLKGSSMTDSAMANGFSDSAHFSKVFRANFGMSPREALLNIKR